MIGVDWLLVISGSWLYSAAILYRDHIFAINNDQLQEDFQSCGYALKAHDHPVHKSAPLGRKPLPCKQMTDNKEQRHGHGVTNAMRRGERLKVAKVGERYSFPDSLETTEEKHCLHVLKECSK